MTVKIKFLNPVSQEKFMHNLGLAKKANPAYKHNVHKIIAEANDKYSFHIYDDNGKSIVDCDIDFYPDIVDIECHDCDYGKLESLLVFDLLDSINENAVIRFIDTKFCYKGSQFFVTQGFPKTIVYKVASDRDKLLEVTNLREIAEVVAEIKALDFI